MSKLKLRKYRESDIDKLVKLANNKNVSRYLVDTFPFPYTKENAIWWIKTGHSKNCSTNYAIEYDECFVGGIGVTPSHGWKAHLAEIGYWVGEEYWNRGIATIALQEMTNHTFSTLNIKKLYAPVFEDNKSSMRVLEKCGYQLEGILNQDVYKDGEYHNLHYYAKIYS